MDLESQAIDQESQAGFLRQTIANLREAEARRQESAIQRREHALAHDIADPVNQLRFIEACRLRARPPVNREAAKVLYALDEWIKAERQGWRLSFEVGMGAFIGTAHEEDERTQSAAFSSYNSKRVDFLLVDPSGKPQLAIEYHGTGHDLSDDAGHRMSVKRLALKRAGIPLVEVPAKTLKRDIQRMVAKALADGAPSATAQ